MPQEGGPGKNRGRWFEDSLGIEGWTSKYSSVQKLLDHLARKTKSEASRRHYLEAVARRSGREGKNPNRLVKLSKSEVEDAVQSHVDGLSKQDRSIRYVNVTLTQVVTFFTANGFKKNRELDVERYHMPSRYRKRPEYVPTPAEVWKMVIAGRNPYEKLAY